MSKADDRRVAQAAYERDLEAAQQRPNIPPARIPDDERCYSGRPHDFSMKGRHGVRRCWYCVKTRAQVEQDAKDRP